MEIKNNLRQLVAKSGMKHKFIALKVDVSDTAFSYWINNHRQPSGIYVARLCEELDCIAQEIYDV